MQKARTKVDFAAVEAAAARIAPHIRRTPTILMEHVRDRPVPNPVHIKLECLQVTGAFKARGVTNRLLTTPPEEASRGIVTASGGNHGLAVARAGKLAGVAATVYLPPSASPAKRREIARWGARIEVVGPTWDDADRAAARYAEREGAVYVHPFKDPQVVAGQGSNRAATGTALNGSVTDCAVISVRRLPALLGHRVEACIAATRCLPLPFVSP